MSARKVLNCDIHLYPLNTLSFSIVVSSTVGIYTHDIFLIVTENPTSTPSNGLFTFYKRVEFSEIVHIMSNMALGISSRDAILVPL